MEYTIEKLSGSWEMKYSEGRYESEENPYGNIASEEDYAGTEPESVCADIIPGAVPGYWEDMTDKFREASFYSKLRFNPEYGVQSYPIAGNPPDTALPNITGSFFYRRSFIFKKAQGEKRIYFGGVQNSVSVWLNGAFLGRHSGYSTPFEIPIPDENINDGENTIVLSVSNQRLCGCGGEPVSGLTSRAANECTGGVTGGVEIRTYKSPLTDAAVLVSDDLKTVTVRTECTAAAALSWSVCDGERTIKSAAADGDFAFSADGLEYWSPENPKLYTLKIKCGDAVLERSFGVRRLAADGTRLLLNGRKYFLRGACEHCCYPDTVHPNHDKAHYRRVIKKLKSLGFNHIRFHTYIPEEEYMQAADELGMLMHVECPNNTTVSEWREIVRFCRKHPSVVIYCCGNELLIDEPFIEYLRECAKIVHEETDALFAPMSAMRGVEYFWCEPEQEKELKAEPFKHHPRRLKALGEFSDVYCTYPNGAHSYFSTDCNPELIDKYSEVYQKPRLSHEICIDGTYTDLSVKDRYNGTRFGKTEMFSSVEKHLADKEILKNAPLYFKNSCEWQRRVRKFCFENLRRSESISGYDFLGPTDTHWHTFGYDVGMMNEFYELKPGESVRNIRMYNSESVILSDIGKRRNYAEGDTLSCNILMSYYGGRTLRGARLTVRLFIGEDVHICKAFDAAEIENGRVARLAAFSETLPYIGKAAEMRLYASVEADGFFAENEWELYLFPKIEPHSYDGITVSDGMTEEELAALLEKGKTVVLFGADPFKSNPTSFRIALAGRTSGNLAAVVSEHPALENFPHGGFCGWQFAQMMEGGRAVCIENDRVQISPIIEVASTHKYAVRQAAMFELGAINGKLIVCSFRFDENDPAANMLKELIAGYAAGESFKPEAYADEAALHALIHANVKQAASNTNLAFNANDKTAVRSNGKR